MSPLPLIWVTGANGQLGQSLQLLAKTNSRFRFRFLDRNELSLTQVEEAAVWQEALPDYIINAGAYTAVDAAEADQEMANLVNGHGVAQLATKCNSLQIKLIHVSTDYVFPGNGSTPYREDDAVMPVNAYGRSKLLGEQLARKANPDTIIVRTSWVYAPFGKNFVLTMLRLMKDRPEISVVNDQWGAPTYAPDLAQALLSICAADQWVPGIYHYANEGLITWYEFASAIAHHIHYAGTVHAIPSSAFPTPAKRPSFSGMNTEKIKSTFGIQIPHWTTSLAQCLQHISA